MFRLPRLAVLLALVLSGCAHTPRADPSSPNPTFFGTWTGTADQFDSGVASGVPDSRWDVEATIGATSRINYPTLNCSGTLTFVSSEQGSVSFTETITSGTERCVSTGTIRFTRDGTALVYQATHESQPSVSVGRLTRR